MAMVELQAASKSFGDVTALSGLTLAIPAGTIAMLLGPNGAGKTTAVRCVTGAMTPTAGFVRTFGLDPATDGESVRKRTGVVPARPALYDRLTGLDNLRYAAQLWEVDAIDSRVARAAERFGITAALDQRVAGYSTGMRARLALARATLHDPELLLLDEPTAGLDPESSRAVLDLIRSMASDGRTVLMCTHLLLEAEGLADYVVVLDRGNTVVAGSPADLTRSLFAGTTVTLAAHDPASLDVAATLPYVIEYQREWTALATLDDPARVSDLVADLVAQGVRLTRVEPRTPSLEELYFAVRQQGEERAA
jgi:ABC-2 type transport system ATP-binding protein